MTVSDQARKNRRVAFWDIAMIVPALTVIIAALAVLSWYFFIQPHFTIGGRFMW
jgi:hypothetical protein